jgi:hypothetical protein
MRDLQSHKGNLYYVLNGNSGMSICASLAPPAQRSLSKTVQGAAK